MRLLRMPSLSNRVLLSITVATALTGLWLTMLLIGTGSVERSILAAAYAGHRPFLADAARLVTILGDGRLVTALSILASLWLLQQKRLTTAIIFLVGTSVGRALTEFQKYEINRLRPDQNPHLVPTYNLSFPSGHSANAAMIYLSLALLLPREHRGRWVAAALVVALMVGASRVMLGVHWPSDVVGGWAYGGLWSLLLVSIDAGLRNSGTPPAR